MPILSGDIQLLAFERLSDAPDGGGRMTGRVIIDGQSNNVFADNVWKKSNLQKYPNSINQN